MAGAFNSARAKLAAWGIEVYKPGDGTGKAAMGPIAEGIEFLGCRIDGSLVSPSRRARDALLDQVKCLLADGRFAIRAAVSGKPSGLKGRREAQTLRQIDLVVNGWGQAFAFCNAETVKRDLDAQITRLIGEFQKQNARMSAKLAPQKRMRILGITQLSDIAIKRLDLSPRVALYSGAAVMHPADGAATPTT